MAFDATTGGSNSNSYVTVAEADAYFLDRQGSWDSNETHKQYYLIKATDYLEATYQGKWKGVKANSTQALAWPRYGVIDADGYPIDIDEIPLALKKATYEAAKLLSLNTELLATVKPDKKRVKIDGAIEVEYKDGTSQDFYEQVHLHVRDLVQGFSGRGLTQSRLIRG